MHIFLGLMLSLILGSCSDKVDYSTPAQSHIEEYTAKLKACQADKSKSANPEPISKPTQENTPPPIINITNPTFEIKPNDMVFGDSNSKVIMIEYFSFTCHHCAQFHQKIFPGLKARYIDTNKIAYVAREFIGSKQDLDAAILSRCEGSIEKFSQFVGVLLDKQDNWAFNSQYREHLIKLGEFGGVSSYSYHKCLEDEGLATPLIENSKEISKSPKFVGTPTFFINGEQYTGAYSEEAISEAIDRALQ